MHRVSPRAFARSNLLVGLLLLLGVAALPAVAGLVRYQSILRQEREAQARAVAVRRSEIVSASLGNMVEGTRQMLVALSVTRIVRDLDPACSGLVGDLRRDARDYLVIAVVRRDGTPVCSSADQPISAQAIEDLAKPFLGADRLVTGQYATVPDLDTPVFGFALPLKTSDGDSSAILLAGLDIHRIEQLLGGMYQAGDMGLALADRSGRVVARAPIDGPNGTMLGATRVLLQEPRSGARLFLSPDGTRRIIGFVPPGQDPAGLLVMAGFDASTLLVSIDEDAARGYLLIGLGAALSILLALFIVQRYIRRPTATLLEAARRWGSGDLGARAKLPRATATEFTGLGAAFNEMAELLQHQRTALQERADLELRLSRARRLEAVGTFASGIAHNFNNVVGAIMGYVELAAEGLPADEPRARHLGEIRRAGERAQELVAHILDYGSRESRVRSPLRLERLVEETVTMLRPSVPMDLLLDAPDGEGYLVAGDAGQLQQVLINLIRNAASASEAGSPITLELSTTEVPARVMLSHGQLSAGPHVCAAVIDHGSGMDAATVERLFQPFFTTRPGGTGLGLATAWEIVRDHDGALDVSSAPGEGTAIRVWLPALGPSLPSQPSPNRTVLVLNSNRSGRLRDEDVIAALGYEPVGFDAIATAVTACQAEPDRFAAVVMDRSAVPQGMPAAGVASALARTGRPVILIDSKAAQENAADLSGLGVVAVIARPVRSGLLAAALARWV